MPSSISAAKRIPGVLLPAAALALVVALSATASASARPAYRVVNDSSDRALMPKNGSNAWGATIVQENRAPVVSQMWYLERVRFTDTWRFRNRQSNLCIHPSDWSGLNGSRLLQATCSNGPEARWYRYDLAPTPKWRFQSVRTYKFMDIADGSSAAGAIAIQNDEYAVDVSQRWLLEYAGDF